jgi:predicted TPR repeat methyltransferase
MLVKAKEKRIYHNLHQCDLLSFMAGCPGNYDVVTCAATLIHFGDLRSIFVAAATALCDDGLFLFTLFPNDDDEQIAVHPVHSLAQGGCFAHGRKYVTRVAEETNFNVELLKDEIHEYHGGTPAKGLIVALRRQPR